MSPRSAPLAALLIVATSAIVNAAAARSVAIFSVDERDGRQAVTRQALAFWNRTLADLGLQPPFLEPDVVVSTQLARVLQTYANRVSGDGWRLYPGADGLEPPAAVTGMAGDILVLLSTERMLSFAWPIGEPSRYLLAIQSDRFAPLDDPGVARNVIAHELGHTLGLTHNTRPGTLMCGSCEMSMSGEAGRAFLPLTEEDRARLIEVHPRREP